MVSLPFHLWDPQRQQVEEVFYNAILSSKDWRYEMYRWESVETTNIRFLKTRVFMMQLGEFQTLQHFGRIAEDLRQSVCLEITGNVLFKTFQPKIWKPGLSGELEYVFKNFLP